MQSKTDNNCICGTDKHSCPYYNYENKCTRQPDTTESKTAEEILKEEFELADNSFSLIAIREKYPWTYTIILEAMSTYAQQREDAILDKAAEAATVKVTRYGDSSTPPNICHAHSTQYSYITVDKQSILNLKNKEK